MGIIELVILALSLSMDAFAVSMCKGLAMRKFSLRSALVAGAWFGGFQAGMPLLGYLLGVQFQDKIVAVDHWIAFLLLALIGGNMIRGALKEEDETPDSGSVSARVMLPMAVATSIDALAIGITVAFLRVNVAFAVSFIGIATFLISALGVKLGSLFGVRYKTKAEIVGGAVLVVLGTKILLEHLGVF